MPLTKIGAENFTVFEDITIPFSKGLNVLVGENGMGKTHIMKLAYAACQAVKDAENITWLAGPLAELKARLLHIRKIWGVEVAVLNEELAGEYKLTC